MTFLWIIAIISGLGTLAWHRSSMSIWSLAGFVGLLPVSFFSPFHWVTLTFLWLIYAMLAVMLNDTPLRRRYLSKPMLALYRKMMPRMSKTEKEAIDAGTVQWAREIFSGAPDWQKMLKVPAASLSEEEQAFLDGPVEELCCMINEWELTHELADLPPQMWQFLKDKGFFSLIISKEYGGLNFSAAAHSAILVKVAAISATVSSTIAVPNSLGPAELIHKYGTDEQKKLLSSPSGERTGNSLFCSDGAGGGF